MEEIKYKKQRSTAGTIFKGLLTLGIHTLVHYKLEDDLEMEYENS